MFMPALPFAYFVWTVVAVWMSIAELQCELRIKKKIQRAALFVYN